MGQYVRLDQAQAGVNTEAATLQTHQQVEGRIGWRGVREAGGKIVLYATDEFAVCLVKQEIEAGFLQHVLVVNSKIFTSIGTMPLVLTLGASSNSSLLTAGNAVRIAGRRQLLFTAVSSFVCC